MPKIVRPRRSSKLFNYNVFFGEYLQYISWAVKNSKTVDTLGIMLPCLFNDTPSACCVIDYHNGLNC